MKLRQEISSSTTNIAIVNTAPCSAKNRNNMFSKYVLFEKGHLNKRAGVWTHWTPPGSATDIISFFKSSKFKSFTVCILITF